ncbi:hypothetical protein EDD37DRAFT_567610 [Exophiala viscosa]|uniref:uncharacterized protein n=1 Tax=Exophiala viscosa TaxID=2486360 RepID=UPI00219790B1|nr:hypothetical protein EDD37DRAFT_567610 [Exophiala viscosa]
MRSPLTAASDPSEPTRFCHLARLPKELILDVASRLPNIAAICLGLTSRFFYDTLQGNIDTAFTDDEQRIYFLHLLEEEHPELQLCHSCKKVYPWKRTSSPRKYQCPMRLTHPASYKVRICKGRESLGMTREVVEAFLRGHILGPQYGPHISGLSHVCAAVTCATSGKVPMYSEGRIIDGKLFIHATYAMIMFLPSFRPPVVEFGPSDASLPNEVMAVVAPTIDKFRRVGCSHANSTLPAVIMDAVRGVSRPWNVHRKCQDLLTCAMCATNVRVSVAQKGPEHVKVQVKTWHCFGGLCDVRNRTEGGDCMEDTLFNPSNRPGGDSSFDWSTVEFKQSSRLSWNLEHFYNEGSASQDPEPQYNGHNWLQRWSWKWCATCGENEQPCWCERERARILELLIQE